MMPSMRASIAAGASSTSWMSLSTITPPQSSRKIAMSVHEHGMCPGGPHAATPCQVNATRACSSPTTEHNQVERKVWALVRPGHSTIATHPLNQDRVKRADLHADTHYEGHVASVEVVWRQARDLARRRIESFTSLVRGLLTRVTVKECGLGAMGGVPIYLIPVVSDADSLLALATPEASRQWSCPRVQPLNEYLG